MDEPSNTLIWSGRIAQYRGLLEVAARPAAMSPVQAPVRLAEIPVNECGHPELASLTVAANSGSMGED
jgi:hypothetical protein